jgi:hypothetical protein
MAKTSPDVPGTWEFQEPPRPVLQSLDRGTVATMHAVDREHGTRLAEAQHWRMGNLKIVTVQEPAGKDGRFLWHLSMSHKNRHPTWDEIKAARYWLLPLDITVGMLLPPPDQYTNVPQQDHVFHLWEVSDQREESDEPDPHD